MKSIVVALLLCSAVAQAHVDPGVYTGVTENGEACTMTGGATTFQDGMRHPLNERVEFEVESVKFSAGHPSVVDAAKPEVSFNHDLFQAVSPSTEGARALIVTMVHSKEFEGPSAYTFINDNWAKKEKTVKHCAKLVLTEPAK